MRQPIIPTIGPKNDNRDKTGKFNTLEPQENRTAKIRIPIETVFLLISSSGIIRLRIFMAIP